MINGPCSMDAYNGVSGQFCHCNDCDKFQCSADSEKLGAGFLFQGGTWKAPPGHMANGPRPVQIQANTSIPNGIVYGISKQFGDLHDRVCTDLENYGPQGKSALFKLPPMNCKSCNFRNEYVGEEHLDSHGVYVCRQCRKASK